MEVASITIAQALLLGFFWWFKTNYYGQTFTCFISNSCLTAALFVGIVLGDIPNAMIIGASVQLFIWEFWDREETCRRIRYLQR